MADITMSGLAIVALNGSVGNTTFSRNYYGAYAKAKKGAPGSTPFLVTMQTAYAAIVSVWQHGMTDADRAQWYTVSQTVKDDLANSNRITGFELFTMINFNLFLNSTAQVITPPASSERGQMPPPILTSPGVGLISLFIPSAAIGTCLVFFSRPLPPGRMSNNQIYGFVNNELTAGATIPYTALYTTRFSAPTSGSKIFVKCIPISALSGLRGVPQYSSVIVS